MKKLPEYLLVVYSLSGVLSIAVSQAAMGLAAAVALVDRGRRTRFDWRPLGIEWPLLAWIVASLLATAFAPDPIGSAGKLKKLVLWAVVFWPPAALWRPWSIGRLFMTLLFAAGVTSLYGVLTFFLQGGPEMAVRIRGFHGFYLTNSGLLLLCTFPAILFVGCRELPASRRWGAGIAAAAILASQFFGALPGAWLGTSVGLLYLAIFRGYVSGAVVLLIGAVALVLAPPTLRESALDLANPASYANLDRLEIWRNGITLFEQRPLTGWGLGDLQPEYARVKSPGAPMEGHMHSVPVHVATSMGIPGLIALTWLFIGLFRALGRARRPTRGFLRRVVDAAEGALVGFLAAGLLEWNLGDSEILALLCFLVGVAIAAGRLAPLGDGIAPPREA
ncbi:MAG: hypothetical protein KC591_10470 [Gemmatimonadetes bacterium]|nr:hypothetical protein [Gemmatimonadota bacterium]